MKNCSEDIKLYHDAKVKLTSSQLGDLEKKRKINRDRVERGLAAKGYPAPYDFVTQGSFAMGTIIQEESGRSYDLDEGVIFTRDSLVGPRGADKTAPDAREMIRNAVDDGSFDTRPEVKQNCVRIPYGDGVQVDMPVYRCENEEVEAVMEFASVDWRESNPRGVTKWFRRAQEVWSHLALLVRLLKGFCKNRPSYSLPSGFALTVLVWECYRGDSDRLDENVRWTFKAVHDRLAAASHVEHPVIAESLMEDGDSRAAKLVELLAAAMQDLEELDLPNCTRSRALKIWGKVFCTDYFDSDVKQAEEEEKAKTAGAMSAFGSNLPKPWSWDEPPSTSWKWSWDEPPSTSWKLSGPHRDK